MHSDIRHKIIRALEAVLQDVKDGCSLKGLCYYKSHYDEEEGEFLGTMLTAERAEELAHGCLVDAIDECDDGGYPEGTDNIEWGLQFSVEEVLWVAREDEDGATRLHPELRESINAGDET